VTRDTDDGELAGRAQGGDVGAYEDLVRRYQDVAFRTAYLITGTTAEAEDAAQEAFVKAYAALARFRPGAPFRPWLLRIVANEARNRRKAAQRQGALALRASGPAGMDGGLSPEVAVMREEQQRAVLDALNHLREQDRLVIAYRYLFELSEAEIAAALDCPRGTVKSRLSRALQKLRCGLENGAPAAVDCPGGGAHG
jgi:RNA polymerase sigma-70 factor (ECF subfamily)